MRGPWESLWTIIWRGDTPLLPPGFERRYTVRYPGSKILCIIQIITLRRSPFSLAASTSCSVPFSINLLEPTVYVMHQQFNIQQLYALPTLYLCVLYLSENKQRLVPLTA